MHGYFDQLPSTDPTLFRPMYAAFMLFTARRYALAPVFAVGRTGVLPSVCLPRSCICIQTAADIVKHLSRPASPIILGFDPLASVYTSVPNSKGTLQPGR